MLKLIFRRSRRKRRGGCGRLRSASAGGRSAQRRALAPNVIILMTLLGVEGFFLRLADALDGDQRIADGVIRVSHFVTCSFS